MGVFVDHRNVPSATESTQLADLFYESNGDGNAKIDAKRNFSTRGNQPFKSKNFSSPIVNSESSKNCVNAVSEEKKPEWVDKKPLASQVRCFHCKMPNHKDLNVPDFSQRRTTEQE